MRYNTFMKKFAKLVVLLVVIIFVLSFAKNSLVQAVLSGAIANTAHVPVRIGSTHLSLFKASIDIRDFRLGNPSHFREKNLADISRIYADLEPGDLTKSRLHFKDIDLNVKEIVVIKNREGKLNVDALKPTQKEKAGSQKASAGKAPMLQIDRLKMSIGRVVYRDYSQGEKPVEQVFDINIKDRMYTNIQNPSAVISLIMVEALTRTSIARLANLDMGLFQDGAAGALSKGLGLVGDGVDQAEKTTKGLLSLFK